VVGFDSVVTLHLSCAVLKLCCAMLCRAQDSDHLWRLSPPARSALQVVLSEPSAALHMTWAVTRTAPLASGKGGPECAADVTVTLAGESRQQLLEVRPGTGCLFGGGGRNASHTDILLPLVTNWKVSTVMQPVLLW
jgi:hypothetical protein